MVNLFFQAEDGIRGLVRSRRLGDVYKGQSLPLFLIFYLRFLGKHSWRLTATLAVLIPVVIFYFFEITLKIILPKGLTEPLFIPLYRIFF